MSETTPAPTQDENPPRLHVVSQYLRNASFENPGAPNFQRAEGENPEMKIDINVDINDTAENEHEVGLKINAALMQKDTQLFLCTLDYAALVRLENVPEQNRRPILLVEVPRQIFPFLRKILHDITRDGGWPPLLLDPIDFAHLYRSEMQKQSEANSAAESDTPAMPDLGTLVPDAVDKGKK